MTTSIKPRMADAGIFNWILREEESKRIYQEVDGYFVWAPAEGGFLNEYALTEMSDYLRSKNALWHWTIQHDPAISDL